MTARTLTTFEILWYCGGPDYSPNRCIGRTRVRRHDLTDAIVAAANLIKRPRGDEGAAMAHGFYVRKAPTQ